MKDFDCSNARPSLRLAILGAGGTGGYYAGLLAQAGYDVPLVARGDNPGALLLNEAKFSLDHPDKSSEIKLIS
jgi:ketopantoate reductase